MQATKRSRSQFFPTPATPFASATPSPMAISSWWWSGCASCAATWLTPA